MKRKIDLFKVGILWAMACSILMLVGAVIYNKFPPIFENLYNKNIFGLITASTIYIMANFIIFTFPTFFVYKSGDLSKKQKKITAKNKLLTKFKKTVFFIIIVIPIIIFFLAFYLIAAGIRGDIFTNSLTGLTDYGYCIGVIVTALLFGFGELNNVEDNQQKHDCELKEMEDKYADLEAKYKHIKKRNSTLEAKNEELKVLNNKLINLGKRELAKLEKNKQLEKLKGKGYVPETLAKK